MHTIHDENSLTFFKKEHPHPLALQQGRQCSLNDSCHETLYQIPKILF